MIAGSEAFHAVSDCCNLARHLVADDHRLDPGKRMRPFQRDIGQTPSYSCKSVPQIPHATFTWTWPRGGGGSGTLSMRTSRLPCQIAAFISYSPDEAARAAQPLIRKMANRTSSLPYVSWSRTEIFDTRSVHSIAQVNCLRSSTFQSNSITSDCRRNPLPASPRATADPSLPAQDDKLLFFTCSCEVPLLTLSLRQRPA